MSMLSIIFIMILIALLLIQWKFSCNNKTDKSSKSESEEELSYQDLEIKKLQKYLLKNPDDLQVLLDISDLYYQKEQYDETIKNIDFLLSKNISNVDLIQIKAHILAADASFKLDYPEMGERHLLEAFEIDKTNIDILKHLTIAKYQKGDYEETSKYSKNIITLEPTAFEGHFYSGMSEYQQGHCESTLLNLKKALGLKLQDFTTIITIGKTYENLNDHENALIYFNNASRIAHNNDEEIESLFNKGSLLMNINQIDMATNDFKDLLKKNPPNQIKLLTFKKLIEMNKTEKDICQVIWYLKNFLHINPEHEVYTAELQHYIELKTNSLLQNFELLNGDDFILLCLKILPVMTNVMEIIDQSTLKDQSCEIIFISGNSEDNQKEIAWFMRNNYPIGIIPVNNLYARMEEISAKKCTLITNSTYNEEATTFSQMRMLSLENKNNLIRFLNKVLENEAHTHNCPLMSVKKTQ